MEYINDSTYFSQAPYMSNKPNDGVDGNALLYVGTRIVILNKFGLVKQSDIDGFNEAVSLASKEPGLLNRGGKPGDPQAFDDYVGVCAAAKIVNFPIALDIAEYGFRNDWIYKNVDIAPLNKMLSFEFWRMPGVVQHIKLCSGIKLNILDQLILAGSIISSIFKPANDTSGRIMDWIKIQSFKDKNFFILNVAKWLFERDIAKKYPHKMGDVFSIYFSPTHPFAVYMKDNL